MKSLLSKFYNSATPSFIFLALPYMIKNFPKLYTSGYYSHYKYALVVLGLIFFQILISAAKETKNRKLDFGIIFVYANFSIFLYGADIVNSINELQHYLFGFQKIRGRIVFLSFALIYLVVINFLWFKRHGIIIILNYSCVILTFLSLFNIPFPSPKSEPKEFLNNYQKLGTKLAKNKPVVLIILDEYASPIELLKVNNDSSLFRFSNHLKQKKWIVRDSFYSSELATINSLSSLFNYNLSFDSSFHKLSQEAIVQGLFMKSSLADSLIHKGVKLVNNGIFHFGGIQPLTRVYYYPTSFIEVLLLNSMFPLVYQSTGKMKFSGFELDYFSTTEHNFKVFSQVSQLEYSENTFYYFHFFMPHGPFVFKNEFKFKPITTKNYIDYWRFANSKILPVLDFVVNYSGYKVVLTGDHGYRNESSINPHNTFAAFYGFDSTIVNQIQSVQDLGSLINGQFQK